MNISLNALWSNSFQYIKSKITDGLSPLEKKVAMIAIAYFSLAALGYFLYRYMRRTSIEEVSHRNENRHVRAPDLRDRKVEDKDKAPLATMEIEKVQVSNDQLSAAQIAIQNADQLRVLLDSYKDEPLSLIPKDRFLYLDVQGQLQGIDCQNDSPIWLNGKQKFAYKINIMMNKYDWEPSKQPAFELDDRYQWGGPLPDPIVAIVDATLHELNQLASGAFKMAKKLFPNDPPDETCWLTIFSDPDVHSSAALLGEVDASEELPKKTPLDVHPTPNRTPQGDEEDLYDTDDLDDKLTPDALRQLKEIPLTRLDFIDCAKLTDEALEHLKAMPLTTLDFSQCAMLTDDALMHLKDLP